MKQTSLIILFLISVDIAKADTIDVNHKLNKEIEYLQYDIKEIRRDQLNYKIEKDVLKETYSSNYTTVQIVISLILGVFAILGYIGLKGITSLKKEYDIELTKIKELKGEFETKLKELTLSQDKVKGQIDSIDSLNNEQSIKIKTIEIKEKINSLYTQKNYQRVLDYIAIGLELSKEDPELLVLRAFSLIKTRNYPEAIEAHKKVLSIDPSNQKVIQNLSEIYLIVGQIESYEELLKTKGEFLKSDNNALISYFETFKLLKQGKSKELKSTILDFVNQQDLSININYLSGWDFSELFDGIKNLPNNLDKNLFLNFTNYLSGSIQGFQIKSIIEQDNK